MNIYELLKVILFGIVEGITEWLPISSTGHLILLDEFIRFNETEAFKEMFDVVIQLGAIMAVVVIYFKKLWPWYLKETETGKKTAVSKEKLLLWAKIIVASVPIGIIGVIFDDKIDSLFYNPYVVSVMLIVYGVAFIVVEIINKKRSFTINGLSAITFKTALIIGLFQVLALIPGTSRSGATIIGAMIIGADRTTSAEFTFFLAIPAMFGASLLKIVKFLADGNKFTTTQTGFLISGMIVAYVVSLVSLKFLVAFIKKHDFKPFGIYRIVLGIGVLAYFIIK